MQLEAIQCAAVSNEIVIGGIYKHYKGKRYKILHIALNSDNDELEQWVVYQGLYNDPKLGTNPIFTKPVRTFIDEVEWQGKQVKRFALEKVLE